VVRQGGSDHGAQRSPGRSGRDHGRKGRARTADGLDHWPDRAIIVCVGLASAAAWAAIRAAMGLRVSPDQEYDGVDVTECGLEAYPEFTSSRGLAP
jgi:hypothetical protein